MNVSSINPEKLIAKSLSGSSFSSSSENKFSLIKEEYTFFSSVLDTINKELDCFENMGAIYKINYCDWDSPDRLCEKET